MNKTCRVCNSEFEQKGKGRPQTCSKECGYALSKKRIKKWNMQKKYNISPENYDEILMSQRGRCAICELHHTEAYNGLYVDHSHSTGLVRGLLCRDCNSAIGLLKEDSKRILLALKYLEERPAFKLVKGA